MSTNSFILSVTTVSSEALYERKKSMKILDRIALFLLIVGGVNWGLVGIFKFDLVAYLFGGSAGMISRIIYTLVALCAIWCISLYFRNSRMIEE